MSRAICNLTFVFFVVVLSAGTSVAKEWRGIVPLHSTKEDIIRAFNRCNDLNPSCQFSFENEFVHVEFSKGAQEHCEREIRPDTVLLVEVMPKDPIALKKLGLKNRDFRRVKLNPTTEAYVDEKNGLVLKVLEGKVVQYDYIASAKDRSSCAAYYEKPQEFAQDIFLSHVPVIYVGCPSRVRAGDTVTFSANLAGQPRISFLWSLSAGKIKSGQGTRVITMDTSGLEGKSIVATVTLGRIEASCGVQVAQR